MKLVNRKIILVWVVIFLVSFLGIKTNVYATGRRTSPDKIEEKVNSVPYVSNEVIVKFKKDKIDLSSKFSISSQLRMLIFNWTNKYETEDTLKSGNILVLKLKEGQNIDEVINKLMSEPSVEYAEPNYYRSSSALSVNDTYKTNLWGLDNIGQTLTLGSGVTVTGTSGADIDVARAWNLTVGSSDVIVAVIDSGVAYTHPDLIDSMWDGSNCKDENGTTIMGGCLHGYDYVDSDNNPLPTNSTHGTQVAGVLAATRNNNKGIVGVSPNIKIMAIRFNFDTASEIKAIDFAIQNGAKIINASFGGSVLSESELAAINRFRDAGGIFITSAGNEATNNDLVHVYPSDYNLDNIISVAATNQNDQLASFSNIGATSVDVAAPGENIYSTNDEILKVDYNFESGLLPATLTSDLGTSWNVASNELWTDTNIPYIEGLNSVITADTLDLSMVSNAKFTFDAYCDTEDSDPLLGGDYMVLEVSSDGSSFSELERWNEYSLRALFGSDSGNFDNMTLDSQYFTSTFKYRLRWVTDTDGDRGSFGNGCSVDNFKLATYTDGSDENYGYVNGTSMAAPYVSGLVGYLWSVKPSATTSEIVTNVLSNGDTLASLSGKTVTGRRINAYNSLVALGGFTYPGPTVSGLSNDALAKKSKTWTWSSDNPSTDQYRFLIDQIADSVPSGTYSTLTTTTFSTGTGTFYIHVQAKDASENEGSVATASFILDNSGPVASVGSSAPNIIILSFGENLYNSVGETIVNDSNVSSRFSDSSGYGVGISEAIYNNQTITIGLTGTPIAGSNIVLLIGSTGTNIYDSLGNASGQLSLVYDGNNWQLNPTNLNVEAANFQDLITSGQITLSGGSTPDSALSITSASDLTITIGTSGSNSSVGITYGTVISELNDQSFDTNLISGTQVDLTSISNLEVGYSAQGAIQWGIPGTTLKFSSPIEIRIYLGSEYDGQGMNIYRSTSLSSGWTNTGLSSTLCTITSGYCAFTATEASYFVAAYYIIPVTPTPTIIPSSGDNNNNNNQSSSSSSNNDGPRCNDRTPLFAPDLFKILTTKGSAKIIYTPVNENITGYAVIYGLKKGDERYGAMISTIHNNQGEQSFTINKLNPRSTYYFKVAAVNGCVSGPWSDWIPAKADRKREINKYKVIVKNKIRTLVNQFK